MHLETKIYNYSYLACVMASIVQFEANIEQVGPQQQL